MERPKREISSNKMHLRTSKSSSEVDGTEGLMNGAIKAVLKEKMYL